MTAPSRNDVLEEAAQACNKHGWRAGITVPITESFSVVIRALKESTAPQGWISVNERLPDRGQLCECGGVFNGIWEITQWRPHPLSAEAAPSPQAAPRDWPEDFAGENGNYWNTCSTCGHPFIGYKRRLSCKVCAAPPSPQAAPNNKL